MEEKRMNKKTNKSRLKRLDSGITLISLAVTILVMLILAGVVLSTTVRK